jgi:hypothetical protein
MSPEPTAQQTPSRQTILKGGGTALAVLGLVKFVALLAAEGFDPARAPWGFLVVFIVPLAIGSALVYRVPRVAAVLLGLFSMALLAFVVGAIVQNGPILEHWSDYLVVYVGGPITVVVIVAALKTARQRTWSTTNQSTA